MMIVLSVEREAFKPSLTSRDFDLRWKALPVVARQWVNSPTAQPIVKCRLGLSWTRLLRSRKNSVFENVSGTLRCCRIGWCSQPAF